LLPRRTDQEANLHLRVVLAFAALSVGCLGLGACSIPERGAAVPAADTARYAPLAAQAQQLLSPAEMGELFKVIALGRGITGLLLGFRSGDRSHTL
jgi:hypothetical protein